LKNPEKLTGSAVRQCSSSWSATAKNVARPTFWSINRLYNSSIDSLQKRKMHTNNFKTKLKTKYEQDSKKLDVDSVQIQQKNSAAQNKSRSN